MSSSQTGDLLPELSVRSLQKIQHGAEKEDADGEQKTWSQHKQENVFSTVRFSFISVCLPFFSSPSIRLGMKKKTEGTTLTAPTRS